MTKSDLIASVADKAGITKKAAGEAIEAVINSVSDALSSGDKVQLVGFGTFEVRQRKARTGRNPKTNQPLHIPAKRVPGFKVGKEFGDAVNKKR